MRRVDDMTGPMGMNLGKCWEMVSAGTPGMLQTV